MFKLKRVLESYFWRLLGLINPSAIKTFTLENGTKFNYPLNSAIGNCLSVDGSFETHELNFVIQSLKPGDVFLDIGANAGLYSVLAAQKVGASGHVYSFEPGRDELNLLSHNIQKNELKNVTIVNKAVSNERASVDFAISHDGAMNSLKKTNHSMQKIKEWQVVETITLDEFIRENQINKVDFIKIDVEGAEGLVFEGAKQLLNSNTHLTILFEACSVTTVSFGYTPRELIDNLKKQGFFLYCFSNTGELLNVESDAPSVGNENINFIACNSCLTSA
jgi:FkbM family methyltransferase